MWREYERREFELKHRLRGPREESEREETGGVRDGRSGAATSRDDPGMGRGDVCSKLRV